MASLVEPHTAILPRHKPGQPVDVGRKLWLAEADGGIVTQARVLEGAPSDAAEVEPSLARHRDQFGSPPDLLTGDRGCSTATVRRRVAAVGVRRVVLPHTGPPSVASRAGAAALVPARRALASRHRGANRRPAAGLRPGSLPRPRR